MRTLQSKVDSKTKRKHLQLDSTVGVEHAEVRPSLFASSQTNDHSDTQLLLTYMQVTQGWSTVDDSVYRGSERCYKVSTY